MTRHPDAHIRRAVRVLAMVGELHRRGYQKLRVMPFLSSSGSYWRCWIGPETSFYRNHGAYLNDMQADDSDQAASKVARYTTGSDNHYFDWRDAGTDDARKLADRFVERFVTLARQGEGWSYDYAGWYQRLLGLAERGWMPVVIADDLSPAMLQEVTLYDVRPPEWQRDEGIAPRLPLPPAGLFPGDCPR